MSALSAAKSVCGLQTTPAQGTLEPQQAGGKPLALISGTSRRMRKPRNSSGKYGMLLKSVRGNVSVKKLRENGLQQLFILYGAGNICGLEAT